jgi:hypothetical protein
LRPSSSHLRLGQAGPEQRVRVEFACVPTPGDRIELLHPRLGIRQRGRVFYADQLQILVKWDNGRSEGLRAGAQLFRVLGAGLAGT